jgi:hypothetical protein
MGQYPHLFTMDRIWLLDRSFPGAARIARLIARTHVLIRLKSDIRLTMVSGILADGSYIAEISGDGTTVTVRVIEYCVHVEGQEVPEMFCLITDLMDITEYPAVELAALYRRRWDGSETALRETKSCLDGAGPSAGPMLRSQSPGLVRQELAAWAAATEMTRGVTRGAALAAVPARKGRRAGQPVQPREIPFTAARRAILAAIRAGRTGYTTGMPLPDIRRYAELVRDGSGTVEERFRILRGHEARVRMQLADLQDLLSTIEAKVAYYASRLAEGTAEQLWVNGPECT